MTSEPTSAGGERLVEHRVEEKIGSVRLNDPSHRNALTKRLSDDLAGAVEASLAGGAEVLVLSASPPVFCAGGSLDDLSRRDQPLGDAYAGLLALARCPVPTLAAVGGPAIGAGVNLPLACDVVLASPEAVFDPRFLDVGIHPGGGHLWRLERRIGAQGAAALVLFGEALSGEEAVRAGLAWRCVDARRLEDDALAMARRVVKRPARLVRRTKATLVAGAGIADADAAFALELEAQQWSVEQPEFEASLQRIRQRLAERRRRP